MLLNCKNIIPLSFFYMQFFKHNPSPRDNWNWTSLIYMTRIGKAWTKQKKRLPLIFFQKVNSPPAPVWVITLFLTLRGHIALWGGSNYFKNIFKHIRKGGNCMLTLWCQRYVGGALIKSLSSSISPETVLHKYTHRDRVYTNTPYAPN